MRNNGLQHLGWAVNAAERSPFPLSREGDAITLSRAEESELIAACRRRDSGAWEQLFDLYHPPLLAVSRRLLLRAGGSADWADEIAARVWFALWKNRAKTLFRYNSQQIGFLGYLSGMARLEVAQMVREEVKRKNIEAWAFHWLPRSTEGDFFARILLTDCKETLSTTESLFLDRYLLSIGPTNGLEPSKSMSRTNYWARRSRLRRKLCAYLVGSTSEGKRKPK